MFGRKKFKIHLLLLLLCIFTASVSCKRLRENAEIWEVGKDLSVANALRRSLSAGWYGSIRNKDEKDQLQDLNSDTTGRSIVDRNSNPKRVAEKRKNAQTDNRKRVKDVAEEVDKLINSGDSNPDYSSKFAKIKENGNEKRTDLIEKVQEVIDQKKIWKEDYDIKIEKYFPGIGTECLHLRDEDVMTDKKGEYLKTLKELVKLQKKSLEDKKLELEKEKGRLKTSNAPQEEVNSIDDKIQKLSKKEKEITRNNNKLKSSLSKLRNSLKNIFSNVKKEFSKNKVDLTASNENIPKDTTQREVLKVLQGYQDIARDRIWDKTQFKVAFGASITEFSLERAPRGYYQIYYKSLRKDANQVELEKDMKYKNKGAKTQYDKHIFSQINRIKGTDEKTTRDKQVKVARFLLESLESKIGEQPEFPDVIPEIEDPSKAEDQEQKDKILWRNKQHKIDIQVAVEKLFILGGALEAASLPKKQLEYFSQKKDAGFKLDTSEKIPDLMLPGAVREDFMSAGRTLALNSVFEDILRRFVSGEIKDSDGNPVIRLKDALSKERYPAQIRAEKNNPRRKEGGTVLSKRWAALNQNMPLFSTLELGTLDASVNPAPTKEAESSSSGLAGKKVRDDLVNKDNFESDAEELAIDVEKKVNGAKKRKNSETDQGTLAKKIKNPTDIEPESEDDNTCVSKRQTCSFKERDVELDESSIEINNDVLTYKLYDAHDKDKTYKVKTKVDVQSLSSVSYGKEQDRYAKESRRNKVRRKVTKVRGRVNTAFGIHGTLMSTFSAIGSFEKGDIKQGAVSTIQASHSLGSLTGINKIVEKVSEKALLKAVAKGAEKVGLTKIAEKASAKLLKIAEEGSERLMGDIPYVGLAFDAYFIAEDIKDLSKAIKGGDPGEIALDSVHLILDIGSTIANVIVDAFGPEFEPIVWAISLVRMAVDDFYIDISTELKNAHGTGEKVLAFFKGLGEGFVDFLTGGLLRGLKQLKEKKKNDDELLSKFSNAKLYYNLSSDCTNIDFTSGEFSSYGGALKFKLNDDDSFTVTISGIPTGRDRYKTVTKPFKCPGLKDIILGIGQQPTLEWKTQDAKLWRFITVDSEDVIDKFLDDKNSLYGSYTGNRKNNEFIAFQGNYSKVLADECKDPDATGTVDLRLKNYFYILKGMEGNDSFFLGPQSSRVVGGMGHDLYYLGSHGGNTIIDNFAYDKLSDTLWLNVTHDHVMCGRKNYDLLIQYCGTHFVQLKNWFYPVSHDFQRHIVLLTRDGVQLKVEDLGFKNGRYLVDCVPLSVDRSKSSTNQCLILNKQPYTEVVTITGGMKDDTIIGNGQSNFINAGPGDNILIGGEGEDMYMIKPKGGCDHINNFAKDEDMDKLFIPVKYKDIHMSASWDAVAASKQSYIKSCERKPRQKHSKLMDLKVSINPEAEDDEKGLVDPTSCIFIQNWFKSEKYRHMTFISQDDVAFNVIGQRHNLTKRPFMLDFSLSAKAIKCDLNREDIPEKLSRVQTIVDSILHDYLIGNDAANFISSHGGDFIRGNGGSDAYKIAESCLNTVIDNYDVHLDNDIIYIDQDFEDIELGYEPTNQSLEVYVKNVGKVFTLLNWFQNKTYRHASLRTSNGYSALLPEIYNGKQAKRKLQAVAVEISLEDGGCSYGSKRYDLSQKKYLGVSKFTAKSNKCSYNITGNGLNNYLDPGPGNPFGAQYLEGGNGSDTYVIGANYGEYNEINNYAKDSIIDVVLLSVEFVYIEVDIVKDTKDIIVKSTSDQNLVNLKIKNFFADKDYQHIVFQSADKITFRLLPHYPFKKALIVDYSHSPFTHNLNASKLFPTASVIYGSQKQSNIIYGNSHTKRLVGGVKNDIINGGQTSEQIEGSRGNDILAGYGGDDVIFGGDGDDNLFGGEGNDVLSGGSGADVIDGGDGLDSVILIGDVINRKGVIVSIQSTESDKETSITTASGVLKVKAGKGKNGDAEGDSYTSIEMVHGSMFGDVIVGNGRNNILSGNEGKDVLITKTGYDILVGGLDEDIYNLTEASGWKSINNFASDNKMDTILAGKISEKPCQYSYNDDLFITMMKADDNLLTVAMKEWYKNKTFQHMMLQYYDENDQLRMHDPLMNLKIKTSVDEWVSYFSTNALVTVLNYSSNAVFVKVGDMIQYVQDNEYDVRLNYVSENQYYSTKRLSSDMIVNSSAIKLHSNILGGVVVAITMSYHRCNNVLAMTSPVTIRTLPNKPISIEVMEVSSVSLTVAWRPPSNLTDPNVKYYQYKCVAKEKVSKKKIRLKTKEAKNSCTLEGLLHGTAYSVRVFSMIGGEKSRQAATIDVTTENLCKELAPPDNGNIIFERIIDGKEYATLACNHGYRMFANSGEGKKKIAKFESLEAMLFSALK
eukprot:gene19569-21499_t